MNNKQQLTMSNKRPLEANVHTLSQDGRGIALIEQKTTFIQQALPDEVVTYRILNKHATYDHAEMTSIIKASPLRITPPCEHFGVCGGCSLQHMSDALQIKHKEKTILEQLLHFGKVKPLHVLAPLSALSLGYRRKARLGVKFVTKKNKLLVGFREKSSRYLADLSICHVLHPKIGAQLPLLSALIANLKAYQQIPQIEIALGDHTAALVIRHMQTLEQEDLDKLSAFGAAHDFHIYLQANPPYPVKQLYPADGTERLSYSLPAENLTFQFHPLDFTQVNLELNRLMVQQALDFLDVEENERVLDLFCGIGNFTLPLAKRTQHIAGIEGSAEMIQRAKDNAALNALSHIQFDAANLMADNITTPLLKTKYDKVLLDPPRAGAKEILPHIAAAAPKKIVYVSCNPATLARDALSLVHEYGYQLTHVGMMNMFPHTAHIEAMAVFAKNPQK